jgi:hypothetical protein
MACDHRYLNPLFENCVNFLVIRKLSIYRLCFACGIIPKMQHNMI